VDNENAKKQILINWGTSYNNIFGQNEQYIESELVKVIHYLLDEQYAVRIYPIWVDDIPSIKRLQEKVADERCQVDLFVSDAKTLQRMIYESFFTINFKLHANILSAAANKPYVSLAYRGKCFDFSQTVHCLDYTIGTDEVTASKVIEMVDDVIENYDQIIQRLTQAKEKYHPKLIHSIKNIATLLQ